MAERERLARLVLAQAEWCARLGSPLYAALMARAADDVLSGGQVAEVLAGHENDPGPSALALRLFGTVHRIVLEGRAPELGRYYPSVGGKPDPDAAWPVFREVVRRHTAEIRAGLDTAPQTNEVGRAAPLVGGLCHVVAAHRRPVRLAEIGASAGLNLRADAFRILAADGSGTGPADSPVVLRDAWEGRLPPGSGELRVVERIGCDVAPVDPTTAAGRLWLTSYVWPDDAVRLGRLTAAFAVAERIPASLVRASAIESSVGSSCNLAQCWCCGTRSRGSTSRGASERRSPSISRGSRRRRTRTRRSPTSRSNLGGRMQGSSTYTRRRSPPGRGEWSASWARRLRTVSRLSGSDRPRSVRRG